MDEDLQEDIVYTLRRGPTVEMNAHDIVSGRNLWRSYLVGFILDERSFFVRRIQTILNSAWGSQC